MRTRYVLAPEAARDLVQIWLYIRKQSSVQMADRVESVIRDRIVFLAFGRATHPGRIVRIHNRELAEKRYLGHAIRTNHTVFHGARRDLLLCRTISLLYRELITPLRPSLAHATSK